MPYGRTPKSYALENILFFVIVALVALVAIPGWNMLARKGYDILATALIVAIPTISGGIFLLIFGNPILRAWRARKEGKG